MSLVQHDKYVVQLFQGDRTDVGPVVESWLDSAVHGLCCLKQQKLVGKENICAEASSETRNQFWASPAG